MKRWGLRWIFCWISVLITTACGQFNSPTPAQENPERAPTLQNFFPPSTASPTRIVRPAASITPRYQATASRQTTNDPQLAVLMGSPACFETAVQSLVCLGWVQNNQTVPLMNTIINFYLLNPQGETLSAIETEPSQTLIPAKGGSPYRVIFDKIPTEDWLPFAEIAYAEKIPPELEPSEVVSLKNQHTIWDGQIYRISGQIQASTDAVGQVRVIVSVFNARQQITGFRIVNLSLKNRQAEFMVSLVPLDNQPGTVVIATEVID
jgi:hypothetical protein